MLGPSEEMPMASKREQFWGYESYAVIGHSAKAPFPRLTYGALKALGKRVVAVDPDAPTIEGDKAYASLADVPHDVDAVVIEVPPAETKGWVEQAADRKVPRAWIHMNRDTPEALAAAADKGVELCTGTCAVQYLTKGFSAHTIHRTISKVLGRY
jgi:predicted CoA-binding protein